jgi:hypothetical protein
MSPTRRSEFCALIVALLVAAGVSVAAQSAVDQQESKAALEIRMLERGLEKLELEVAELKKWYLPWLNAGLGLVAGIVGTFGALFVTKRELLGAVDQSVHECRLERYPKLVNAMAPLALYFPSDKFAQPLGPADCAKMGRAFTDWYFEDGGLLLSDKSRGAYFNVQRALTRAARATNLKMPIFPADEEFVSFEKMPGYREALSHLDDIDGWPFGGPRVEGEPPHRAFHSRRRPADAGRK